jgi:hypothetical protein
MPILKKLKSKRPDLRKQMTKSKHAGGLAVKPAEAHEAEHAKAKHEREHELTKMNPSHTYLSLYHH